MRVGDLVVRIWVGQPKWDMIGLVVFCEERGPLSEDKVTYGIKWNVPPSMHKGERNFGQWTKNEVRVISDCR